MIALDHVSHMVSDIEFEGNDVYVVIKVLDTSSGRTLKVALEKNVGRFTPRSYGQADKPKGIELLTLPAYVALVQRLIAIDYVVDENDNESVRHGVSMERNR